MLTQKKVELIIPSALASHKLIEELNAMDLKGFSVIKDVLGKGESGYKSGDLLVDVWKNTYIIIVCDEAELDGLLQKFRPLITKYGGICMVSDVLVLKKDSFKKFV